MTGARATGSRAFFLGVACLSAVVCLLAASAGLAQLPSLEERRGELAAGWTLERVEEEPDFIRLHFARGADQAHVEVNLRSELETDVATEHYSLQAAPEGFAPPDVQEQVLTWLREADVARERAAALAVIRGVQVSRVIALLQGLLGLALALGLLGLLRSRGSLGVADWRRHALPLLVFTVSGALLRVAQGPRLPGREGGHGEGFGHGDVGALLSEGVAQLDAQGSGHAALAQLWFLLWPREEWALLALQAGLAILTIPLVYLGALTWLRLQREATWATAVYALAPYAAYFAMTEVRPVPGTFFLVLAVVVTGAGLERGRATLLACGGLLAVLATSFHLVLAPAPLVLVLLVVARRDRWPALKSPAVLAAVATVVAAWAILLWLLWVQLSIAEPGATVDGHLGGGASPLSHAWRALLPSWGPPQHPFNAFLNVACAPAVAVLCWFIGLAGVRKPTQRRALVTLGIAALVMTLPGMSGGRYNPARLQLAAAPFHAMLAGVGCVGLIQHLLRRRSSRRLRRVVPAALAVALGLSVAVSPGPLSGDFVLEGERRVTLRALPALRAVGAECNVWVPPTTPEPYLETPAYLTRGVLPAARWRVLGTPRQARSAARRSLLRDGCAYYFRPATCWLRVAGEPLPPDPTAMRDECADIEAQFMLSPVHVESIDAQPAAAASYRRPRVEVGFFRIDLPPL